MNLNFPQRRHKILISCSCESSDCLLRTADIESEFPPAAGDQNFLRCADPRNLKFHSLAAKSQIPQLAIHQI